MSGAITVCIDTSNNLSDCSSSRRYKTAIQPMAAGLTIVERLRPVTFDWAVVEKLLRVSDTNERGN